MQVSITQLEKPAVAAAVVVAAAVAVGEVLGSLDLNEPA